MAEPHSVDGPQEVVPQILCDTRVLTGQVPATLGALWNLAEPGRQLDVNFIHLPRGEHIKTHTEPDLDVLLFVVAGEGTVGIGMTGEPQHVAEGMLLWLPHGSTCSITAGDGGIHYLTVHRRPGMQIRPRPDQPAKPELPH
ncbi:cupin domain-containing protein [Streptomyces anandii]|uniref:Cupin domain-containing protein n=1 Tax=Streptomyces anandii TaxID=285454 RepID=A0ABW6HCT0_9ACTN